MDLRKAYDTVPRLLLLETFANKLGIARETVAAMARLYTDITAQVIINNELSEPFDLNEGVR